jgi:hypothetical protein
MDLWQIGCSCRSCFLLPEVYYFIIFIFIFDDYFLAYIEFRYHNTYVSRIISSFFSDLYSVSTLEAQKVST